MTSKNEKTPVKKEKESFLWWRHRFYRSRWKDWHIKWLGLAYELPAGREENPATVLGRLTEINCDPDVALRLAFLEANHKPATQSQLAKDNKRQQSLKRKLTQSQKRLLKTALELEQADSDFRLIFVELENIDSLRTLATMCGHEIQTLLWPRALELPPGHELFTLVAYVKACSENPHYALVTGLLEAAYSVKSQRAPSQEAITKQVQRFRKPDSLLPSLIEEDTLRKAKSGELREDLLTCYPNQTLPL